ncbi:MAG: hypothetical protein II992_02215 [Lachnospiraceae bacterium]|nr:hypothetical protein [Lachnospiraceae bacterium]
MKNRILNYRKQMDSLLGQKNAETDWEKVLEEHLVQVAFFQHERLIHLIVTVTFAVLLIICFGILILSDFMPILGLIGLLFVLLVPYIRHYYTLENEVQRMYEQYDKILKQLNTNDK